MEIPVASFAEIATDYATEVVEGKIVACKWHRLACERHLNDLKRPESKSFPFAWNPELTDIEGRVYRPADRVCKFAELMPHIKATGPPEVN